MIKGPELEDSYVLDVFSARAVGSDEMRPWKTAVVVLLSIVAVSTSAWPAADPTSGMLNGSAHDLRNRLQINQFCLPCHVPHKGAAADAGPLFNHQLTTATFTRHTQTVTLTGSSKLCMSCHDGVTAIGNYGTITNMGDVMSSSANLGTILDDDHPISIDYPVDGSWSLEARADVDPMFLEENKVECGSCHYAHGGENGNFRPGSKTAHLG